MAIDVVALPDSPTRDGCDHQPVVSGSERVITGLIVGIPFAALVFGVIWFWGRGVHLRDVVLAVVLFFVVGHAVTIGFHRMLTHGSFKVFLGISTNALCWSLETP